MNKYINIEVAKEYLRHDSYNNPYFRSQACQQAIDVLDTVSAADVVEVKYGRWRVESKLHPLPWDTDPLDWDRYDTKTHSELVDYYVCSECHKGEYPIKPRWNYCPNCGAKMNGR